MNSQDTLNLTDLVEAPKPNGGPATPEGRAISSKNATKHGCCADTLILPHESEADLKSSPNHLVHHLQAKRRRRKKPHRKTHQSRLALPTRHQRPHEVEADLYDANPNASQWTELQQRTFGRFQRYQTAKANLFNQAKKAVEDYRKARQAELDRAAKLALLEERLKAFKKKNNQKEPTWQEHLDDMKKQAISLGFTPPTEDEL